MRFSIGISIWTSLWASWEVRGLYVCISMIPGILVVRMKGGHIVEKQESNGSSLSSGFSVLIIRFINWE